MTDDFPLDVYRRAFNQMPSPAIVTDPMFVIRDANEACVEYTGYEHSELEGMTPDTLFTDPQMFDDVAEALVTGQPWTGYFELKAKDGRFRFGHGTALPLYAGGELVAYLGIFVDLTQQRSNEQAIRILNRVLRHNLRNEANIILGCLGELADHVTDDDAGHVETATRRIEQLLDRADTARRLETVLTADPDVELDSLDLAPVLRAEVASLEDKFPRAEVVLENCPEVAVAADKSLGDALEAVLENAVVHNDGEHPSVSVSVDANEDWVTVSVADDGPGLQGEDEETVFGLAERSQVYHGGGFDLFYVSKLIERYSGRLSVRNRAPEGATFLLRFQRRPEGAA